jgi:Na+-driven multidrug efflux pump
VGGDPELLELTSSALNLYALSFALCGFNIFGSAFFTALGNGPVSALISFLRTLVFECGSVLVLPLVLGPNGIWLAIVVAELAALVVTFSLLVGLRKSYGY